MFHTRYLVLDHRKDAQIYISLIRFGKTIKRDVGIE